jgi:GNAT superfamily N-acetyltransferase
MRTTITSFQTEFIEQAAQLLAERHSTHRSMRSELPARFEHLEDARAALMAAWQRPNTSGAAAFDRDRLIGYVIGDETEDPLGGRTAMIRQAGHALAANAAPDLYKDLYAAAGERWVTAECFDHYILTPAADMALSWFGLGFGQEQVYALRALDSSDEITVMIPKKWTIRRAIAEDKDLLASVSPWIASYQTQAPVWAAITPEYLAEIREGYAELASDPAAIMWLVIEAGECIGFQLYYEAETSDSNLLIPDHCVELVIAGTHPDWRGKGVNRLLTQIGFADALHRGYTCCTTDYRATNPLSSRFWSGFGFAPAFYRLTRHIDPRVLGR